MQWVVTTERTTFGISSLYVNEIYITSAQFTQNIKMFRYTKILILRPYFISMTYNFIGMSCIYCFDKPN